MGERTREATAYCCTHTMPNSDVREMFRPRRAVIDCGATERTDSLLALFSLTLSTPTTHRANTERRMLKLTRSAKLSVSPARRATAVASERHTPLILASRRQSQQAARDSDHHRHRAGAASRLLFGHDASWRPPCLAEREARARERERERGKDKARGSLQKGRAKRKAAGEHKNEY